MGRTLLGILYGLWWRLGPSGSIELDWRGRVKRWGFLSQPDPSKRPFWTPNGVMFRGRESLRG